MPKLHTLQVSESNGRARLLDIQKFGRWRLIEHRRSLTSQLPVGADMKRAGVSMENVKQTRPLALVSNAFGTQ